MPIHNNDLTLPEPEGPINARISPGAAVPETSLRIVFMLVVRPFFLASGEEEGGAAMLARMRPLIK